MTTGGFGFRNLLTRWLLALFVVLATYNPSGSSYLHWLLDMSDTRWSLKALAGVVMIVLNLTFFFASLRSLGITGLLAGATFCGTVIWTLIDHGYLLTLTPWTWVTIILLLFGSVQAVGVSWSHIRGRLSGQADTNDVTL
jgi:hypothetical protein